MQWLNGYIETTFSTFNFPISFPSAIYGVGSTLFNSKSQMESPQFPEVVVSFSNSTILFDIYGETALNIRLIAIGS